MGQYIARRALLMVPMLIAVSILTFMIIELPPGDYISSYMNQLASGGETVQKEQLDALRKQLALDQPVYARYFHWMAGVVQGDFGYSFAYKKPVKELIWDRLVLTVVLTLSTMLFTWVVGFFIGVYSATHQYSFGDYLFTTLGFIGLGVPDFLIALVVMWVAYRSFGANITGLFSREFMNAPWSWARVVDLLRHLWLPILILGVGGTAGMIRTMRANMLDELHKPYVVTARAKGLTESRLLLKYPVRVALNPFVSSIAWALPGLISGATIISVVLSLPTTGPLMLQSLREQDMYLAATFLLLLSTLTVLGTLVSDVLLGWLDPRIRVGG